MTGGELRTILLSAIATFTKTGGDLHMLMGQAVQSCLSKKAPKGESGSRNERRDASERVMKS